MALMLCDDCLMFKESYERLTKNSPEYINRTPFHDFAALEKSAFLGCTLCQIIHQTWYQRRYSEKYKKDSRIKVKGYTAILGSRRHGIHVWSEDSIAGGFTLAGVNHQEVTEDQFSQYKTAWRQITDPNTPERISQITSLASMWIRKCQQTHHSCESYSAKKEPQILPTRLIDVGTDDPSQPPRLFIPQPHHGSLEYVTLSYAWGMGNFIKTTYSNLEAMTHQLPWTQLPKTIRDAILVTRRLGVQYLWVDALCILQSEGPDDMKHRQDWSYEVARFGKYYENALLTIAATGASSSDQGLFLPVPVSRLELQSLTFRPGHRLSYTVRSMIPSWLSETLAGPLSSRGWAIQERLLSRRVLHFSEKMLLWECHDCRATELDPHGLNPRGPDDEPFMYMEFMTKCRDLYAKGLVPDRFMSEWYGFVRMYTNSDFTFVSDRLPALSGIATIIQQHTQQRYVAGLWVSDIHKGGLAWHSYGAFRFDTSHLIYRQITNRPAKSDSQITIPSWSWAACEGGVMYAEYKNWISLIEVESCQVNSEGTSTSGQLRGARLTLRGVLAMINISDLGFKPHTNKNMPGNSLTREPEKNHLTMESVCMDSRMDSQTRHISHPCLLIGRTGLNDTDIGGGLVLKDTGRHLSHMKEYRRIGYMSLYMKEVRSIFTEKETTISLI
ncbi:hypothetical protein FSHL1_009782 [Fusarium sambucinum]